MSVNVETTAGAIPGPVAGPREPAPRVLLLLEDLGGGTGNHVCRLISQWTAAGCEVLVVTQTPPLVRQLPPGVEVRVMRHAGWYDRFPVAQMRRVVELSRIVREFRPDVVHTYFFWSLMYGRMLKALHVAPVLVENREDMGFSWGTVEYLALRLSRSVPDRIICVADAVRRVSLRRELALPARTTVVHNGIALQESLPRDRAAARRRFGFDDDAVVVGMVANLPRAVKGGRRLLDGVAAVVTAAPSTRFLLVGLGTEPDTLRAELHARGIEPYVVGAGYQPDVDACYAAMDISVLTSSSEGLSITLLESMRHGLPAVVTNVGGNPEVVVEGETGFLVPLDDLTAFVDRVVTLARDASLRRAMGDAGRRRVAERFAIDAVARRYLDIYRDLLATPVSVDTTPHQHAPSEIHA